MGILKREKRSVESEGYRPLAVEPRRRGLRQQAPHLRDEPGAALMPERSEEMREDYVLSPITGRRVRLSRFLPPSPPAES